MKTIADVDHYLQMIHHQFSDWSIPCITETPFLSLYLSFFNVFTVFYIYLVLVNRYSFLFNTVFFLQSAYILFLFQQFLFLKKKFRKRFICPNSGPYFIGYLYVYVLTSDLYQIKTLFNS
jgi:hypothetical protein